MTTRQIRYFIYEPQKRGRDTETRKIKETTIQKHERFTRTV